jgi:hypothetical protein
MRDKQIEEMAKVYDEARLKARETLGSMNKGEAMWYSEAFYNAGYRKIYDDHQWQCTCYALGCQMAEELEKKVAREIFEEIEKRLVTGCTFYGQAIHSIGVGTFAKLKKKFTEEGK